MWCLWFDNTNYRVKTLNRIAELNIHGTDELNQKELLTIPNHMNHKRPLNLVSISHQTGIRYDVWISLQETQAHRTIPKLQH